MLSAVHAQIPGGLPPVLPVMQLSVTCDHRLDTTEPKAFVRGVDGETRLQSFRENGQKVSSVGSLELHFAFVVNAEEHWSNQTIER